MTEEEWLERDAGREPEEMKAGDAEEVGLTIHHHLTDVGSHPGSPRDAGLGSWGDGNATSEERKRRPRVWFAKPLLND